MTTTTSFHHVPLFYQSLLSYLFYTFVASLDLQTTTMPTHTNADDAEVEPTSPADLSASTGSDYAKGRGKAFMSNDTLLTARAFMDVSTDTAKGINLASDTDWQQIEKKFNKLAARSNERVEGYTTIGQCTLGSL